jgi:hypothetical protein
MVVYAVLGVSDATSSIRVQVAPVHVVHMTTHIAPTPPVVAFPPVVPNRCTHAS